MAIEHVTNQLDVIIEEYCVLQKIAGGGVSVPDHDYKKVDVRAISAIRRIAGTDSIYYKEAISHLGGPYPHVNANQILACLNALRADITAGYLHSVAEIIHADVFTDFLEMADYLVCEGYKDAAAVIAGSTLEGHLRQLCAKHGIAVSDGTRAKKAEVLNAELTKASAYEKGDQKNVTAWLDLRNKAAHGHYGEYTREQVQLLIASIRDFINRVPA